MDAATTTVVTQHWQLEKYSRSRSRTSPAAPSAAPAVEWDHYTQPRLALRLEAKYTNYPTAASTLVPDQLLLKVTYDPLYRDRTPPHAAAAPLLLDSIDLASFSNPQLAQATPKGQLPLKAVYRDAVLGLRYLVLTRPAAAAAEFRRVQAKFTSTAERERFVDAIRVLVPVKPAAESATNANANASATATANPTPQLAADDGDAPDHNSSSSKKKTQKRKSTGQQQPPLPQSSIPFATPQSQSQQNHRLAAADAPGVSTRRAKRARNAATVTASGSSSGGGVGGTRLDELDQQQRGEYPPQTLPPSSTSSSSRPSFLNAARSSAVVDNGLPYYSHQGLGAVGGGFLQPQYQQQQITTTGGGGGGAASLLGRSGPLASLLPRLAATAAAASSKSTPTHTISPVVGATTTTTNYKPTPREEDRPYYQTASLALLALEPDELDRLLQDALLEEGFEQLVQTVKDALGGA